MKIYFSASTLGFYDEDPLITIPGDAVEVTAERRSEILHGQSNGMVVSADSKGNPTLIDQPPPSVEFLSSAERIWRAERMAETDFLVMPDYPLTDDQKSGLLAYRKLLRDWPSDAKFPDSNFRPVPPSWLPALIN